MDMLTRIVKIIVALGLVAVLLIFGVMIFAALLAVAGVASVIFWLRKRNIVNAKQEWNNPLHKTHTPEAESVTIIEGQAEEVTLGGAA